MSSKSNRRPQTPASTLALSSGDAPQTDAPSNAGDSQTIDAPQTENAGAVESSGDALNAGESGDNGQAVKSGGESENAGKSEAAGAGEKSGGVDPHTFTLRALPFVLNRPRHSQRIGEEHRWSRNEPSGKLTLATDDNGITLTRPEVPEERDARAGKLPAMVTKDGVSIATPAEYTGSAGESFARIPFAAFGCSTPEHREALTALVVGLVVSCGRGVKTPGDAAGPVVDTATVKTATAKFDPTLQSGIMALRGAFAAHVLPTLPATFAEARAAGAELTKACRKALAVALAGELSAEARACLIAGAALWGMVYDPAAKMIVPAPSVQTPQTENAPAAVGA